VRGCCVADVSLNWSSNFGSTRVQGWCQGGPGCPPASPPVTPAVLSPHHRCMRQHHTTPAHASGPHSQHQRTHGHRICCHQVCCSLDVTNVPHTECQAVTCQAMADKHATVACMNEGKHTYAMCLLCTLYYSHCTVVALTVRSKS
jgi:hypothetical protein